MSAPVAESRLPAVLSGRDGSRRLDYRAVIALAWPLFLQFSVQAVMNVTDTWFVVHLGSYAVAGMNAVNVSTFTLLLLFGGRAMAVQTIVAKRFGGGRNARGGGARGTPTLGAGIVERSSAWFDVATQPCAPTPRAKGACHCLRARRPCHLVAMPWVATPTNMNQ